MVSSIHHPEILDKLLAGLTDPAAPRNKTVPGIALVIRSKDGRVIYSQGNGSFDVSTPSWLASCTKLVTPIALLQLVEKGLITLDEPVQRFLPRCDLSHVLVGFDGEGKPMLQPVTTVVTLRNLLNHTNGLGNLFASPARMRLFGIPNPEEALKEMLKYTEATYQGPLDHEPESAWSYSTGHETAGLLLEAITRQNFEDYLQAHICRPLNLKSTSFIPPPGLPDSIASRAVVGDSTSEWQKVDYPMSQNPEMHSGGTGLYSTAEEFSLILAEVLNDGGRLFEHAETAGLLFESRLTPAARRDLGAFLQRSLTTSPDMAKAWETAEPEFGLGYLVNAKDIVETGRKAGTGFWGGMSGTTAWIDRKTGVACALFTQTYPDAAVTYAQHVVEKQVYKCLSGGE